MKLSHYLSPLVLFFSGVVVGAITVDVWLPCPQPEIPTVVATASPVISDEVLFPCTILSVHDADTMQAVIQMPWNISLTENVRCLGYDAWEVTKGRRTVKVTDEEVEKGKVARDELKKLLVEADRVFLSPENDSGTRDPYGRPLGFIRVQEGDELIRLEQWMVEHGHVRGGE